MSDTPKAIDFEAMDSCHQQMLTHLTELAALAQHIEAEGVDATARRQAGAIESFFSHTSRQHHADEEKHVFPSLLAGGSAELVTAVRTLQQDHGWIEENWIELAPELRAIASGNTWIDPAEFQHNVEVFLALCRDHIALEETLIYPAAKAHRDRLLAKRLAAEPGIKPKS